MAPNKFEKHIRKQLEGREIEPTANAWANLSEKLDLTERQQSKKRNYLWYGVAASIIGLLIVSVVFFNTERPVSKTNTVVGQDENEPIKEMNEFKNIEIQKTKVEVVFKEKIPAEKAKIIIIKKTIEIAEKEVFVESLGEIVDSTKVPFNDNSEEILNAKVLEVLAHIDFLEKDKQSLTDAEVDSLLLKAQEDILKESLSNLDNSVNAMALLTEVEDELDQSFRNQIFESLKSKFLKVKTAVADRNN